MKKKFGYEDVDEEKIQRNQVSLEMKIWISLMNLL